MRRLPTLIIMTLSSLASADDIVHSQPLGDCKIQIVVSGENSFRLEIPDHNYFSNGPSTLKLLSASGNSWGTVNTRLSTDIFQFCLANDSIEVERAQRARNSADGVLAYVNFKVGEASPGLAKGTHRFAGSASGLVQYLNGEQVRNVSEPVEMNCSPSASRSNFQSVLVASPGCD